MLSIRNRIRALKAVHRGLDTFIATDGSLRYARNFGPNEPLKIDASHLPLIKDDTK